MRNSTVKVPLLAAVGPLQFEVVQYRLESEYTALSRLETAPFETVRWLPVDIRDEATLDALSLPTGARLATDMDGHHVALFTSGWSADYFNELNPKVPLSPLPPS